MNKKFNKESFSNALKELKKEGYIQRYIDETQKSNQCWHIEIKVNHKPIPKYFDGSILNQAKYIC